MIYAIPFPLAERGLLMNWAAVLMLFAFIYYLRLSIPMFLGFIMIGGAMLLGIDAIYNAIGQNSGNLALIMLAIFALAWVAQFIGHKIEGAKPSFLEDVQFLLIGPAWLLHFIYRKVGIHY